MRISVSVLKFGWNPNAAIYILLAFSALFALHEYTRLSTRVIPHALNIIHSIGKYVKIVGDFVAGSKFVFLILCEKRARARL